MKKIFKSLFFLQFLIFYMMNFVFAAYQEVKLEDIESIKLLGHQMNLKKIYMSKMSNNEGVIRDVKNAIKNINKIGAVYKYPPIKLVVLQRPYDNTFTDDETRRIFPQQDLDMWLRDFGKIVAVKLKGDRYEQPMVLDLNRGRGLSDFARDLAYKENILYFKAPVSSIAGNYGGNIDVTPNNVLYIGDSSSPALRSMFINKGYFNRHAVLHSNWLRVGHVDEFLSTVILPKTEKCRIGIVKASPKLALDILKHSSSTTLSPLKSSYPNYYNTLKSLRKLLTYRKNFFSREDSNAKKIFLTQGKIISIIDSNVSLLINAISKVSPECQNPKVLEYPTLYECARVTDSKTFSECSSLLPGSVNMTVIRRHLLIPDPLYAPYREAIKRVSEINGQYPNFINDMPYHLGIGELHCGTNCLFDLYFPWASLN